MKLLMKFVHELASYGLAGGFAAQLIVLARRTTDPEVKADLLGAIGIWLVAPCFVVVCVSGLWAMVLRPSFFSRGWVWMKIFLTAPLTYVGLATLPGLSVAHERLPTLIWIGLVASVLITAFSVWRPKGFLLD